MQLPAERMPPPSQPLTAQSTVRNAEDAASLAQPATHLESAVVPPDFQRQKIPLEKGFSQMDWMKLSKKGLDLHGKPMNGKTLLYLSRPDTPAPHLPQPGHRVLAVYALSQNLPEPHMHIRDSRRASAFGRSAFK